MRSHFIRILSVFLLGVFTIGVMPKEVIHHVLYHHTDDVHPAYKKGEIVITKQHNHCGFLSFEVAPFLVPDTQFSFSWFDYPITGFAHSGYCFLYADIPATAFLRGPPAHSGIV